VLDDATDGGLPNGGQQDGRVVAVLFGDVD
jgi:hypothetical protein